VTVAGAAMVALRSADVASMLSIRASVPNH
jgi:hypothetical protein